MKTGPHAGESLPSVPYRHSPFVLLVLVFAILAITWPWVQSFSSAFFHHWDPPFHAWKLEFVSRAILSGHLLPPEGNTNMYYPHSGTLYYEALHWPQALVAAPLFLAGLSPVLVYHLVLVFFWALSGLCFWMLLLALGATRRAALLGALLFTIMPYRISYMVEFNMQLCFGLPLFFFFMVRFFQQPSIRYACGMAVAWWLQASSELYQAVFLLLILPFPGLALLAARWRLLASFRRFWLPFLCAAALGGTLTWILLGPYLTMLNVHAVNRNLHEIATHILEPLSYLRPGGRFHFLFTLDARRDEMIVYPTLAMILLASAHLVFDARRLSRIAVPRWVWAFRAIRWSALLLFFLLTFLVYFHGVSGLLAHLYAVLPVVACLAALAVLLHPTARDAASLFTTGLFAGAIFAFFLSMGPAIVGRHALFQTPNVLYIWIYKHLTALQGFRVVSRFSIFLLIFMAVAAALAWSTIERRWLHRPALRWLWLVPLFLALPECLPLSIRMVPIQAPLSTPVLDRLDRMDQPFVLAMSPMGDRYRDSRYMLQIARSDRLFVYAWGGAYPRYTRDVRQAMDSARPDPVRAASLLRQLWPECFVLEDKDVTRTARIPWNFAWLLSGDMEVADEDERFALLRFKPQAEPSTEQIRLVRHDFLAANPLISFRARTPSNTPPATLWLDVNGYPAGRWELSPEPRDIRIAIPDRYFLPILPNRFRFHASGDAPFHLDSFAPRPADPAISPAPTEDFSASECPPWVGHVHQVPVDAAYLNIHYPNGYSIVACEPLAASAAPGGAIRLRYFIQSPRDMATAVNMAIHARIIAPDGSWFEEEASFATHGDLNDVRCQIHPAIYAFDHDIPVPGHLAPGDYSLSLLLRNEKNKRMTGRQDGQAAKLFPVPIAIRIVPQAPAGP